MHHVMVYTATHPNIGGDLSGTFLKPVLTAAKNTFLFELVCFANSRCLVDSICIFAVILEFLLFPGR